MWPTDKKKTAPKKDSPDSEHSGILPAEAPARRGMILICEKCGHNDSISSKDLRAELKHLAKAEGHKGDVRVVYTSCMSLCPKHGIAVCVAPTGKDAVTEFFVVEGEAAPAARGLLARLT